MGGTVKQEGLYGSQYVNNIYVYDTFTEICEEKKNSGPEFSSEGCNLAVLSPTDKSTVIALVGEKSQFTPAIIKYKLDSDGVRVLKNKTEIE